MGNPLNIDSLAGYWSNPVLGSSIVIIFNLLGALVLGALVGYERTFRSRAAGMRTLGLVCMGSAAFTIVSGFAHEWYGGIGATAPAEAATRVIQGIVTGIGFLGAGVILKDGTHISGLTTAAMIWVVAAIGVLVGVGLYPAAIILATISAAFTMWGARFFEARLPVQSAVVVTMKFTQSSSVDEGDLKKFFKDAGYNVARNTIAITAYDDLLEWKFVAIGRSSKRASSIPILAGMIKTLPDLKHFNLSYARN